MKSPIRVFLVEDHAIMRAGLRSLLHQQEDIEVCGEAADGREALHLVKQLKPDVVVMDITMPGLNGLDTITQMHKDDPNPPVIILTVHATKSYVMEALRVGAVGYVLKNAAFDELEQAIKTVASGGKYITPAVSAQIIEGYTEKAVSHEPNASTMEMLTSRQREVLQLLAEGLNTRVIAEKLHISIKTVETHRAHLMERLGVDNLPALVKAAIRLGLITLDT